MSGSEWLCGHCVSDLAFIYSCTTEHCSNILIHTANTGPRVPFKLDSVAFIMKTREHCILYMQFCTEITQQFANRPYVIGSMYAK